MHGLYKNLDLKTMDPQVIIKDPSENTYSPFLPLDTLGHILIMAKVTISCAVRSFNMGSWGSLLYQV